MPRRARPTASAELVSRRVLQVVYIHVDEPEGPGVERVHPFGPGVELWALPTGEILLQHSDGAPLWARFRE